ncbi:MAG: hypothetical protein DRJ63_04825 [Thermoprotei archaeon]|nr:MAG: hypothetical protein DRJ63_04825 [Thermoprotei archaeon]
MDAAALKSGVFMFEHEYSKMKSLVNRELSVERVKVHHLGYLNIYHLDTIPHERYILENSV